MDKLKKVTTAIMNGQCLFMKIFTINNCPKGFSTTFSVFNKLLFQPNSYFVCILEYSDNSYYTCVTNNLERRIIEHDAALNTKSYTTQRLPVKLVFHQFFQDIRKAIAFEKQVKGWSRKKKEAIINNNWELLIDLSKKNNSYS